ncbi:MAG: hypothetical protein MRY64_08060 [Hyphomonadaceae bacterium]|nr:hypothetical protein [Hyphomonadaceae bacterium]
MRTNALQCVSFCVLGISLAFSAQAQEPEAAVAAEEEARLDILIYRIVGNSVLDRIDVERAVMPYLGPDRPVSDVENARQALVSAYREKGYETVDIRLPAQDVRGGVIRFEVVEFEIGRLRVEGARYYSPEDIMERLPSLKEGRVPNYSDVSREIAQINQSTDRLITPSLRAGATPGTVDVDLFVEDTLPVHGSVELNDRASARTERLRLSAAVNYNNLFQLDHSVNLQAQITPQDLEQAWVVSASYVAPVRNTPFTLVGYAVHSDSDVAAIGGINVLGSGDIVGLRGIMTRITGVGNAALVHQVTAGIDYKSFEEDLSLGGGVTTETPIDYVPLSLRYSLANRQPEQSIDFGVGLNFGVRGLDADNQEFQDKRFGASASWVTLKGDFGYSRTFAGDWRARLDGAFQYAGKPVISNEQFSAGGLDSVRAYYEGQIVGDDGIATQFQLEAPSLFDGSLFNEFRPFAFADGATLRVHQPLAGQDETDEIASVGLGLRAQAFERLNASVLVSHALVERNEFVAASDDPNAELIERDTLLRDVGDDLRIQFRLWADF